MFGSPRPYRQVLIWSTTHAARPTVLLDGMLLIGSVIAMPLGDDEDDFPAGSFIESLEDACLAPGSAIEQYHPAYSKVTNLTRRKVDDQGRGQKD